MQPVLHLDQSDVGVICPVQKVTVMVMPSGLLSEGDVHQIVDPVHLLLNVWTAVSPSPAEHAPLQLTCTAIAGGAWQYWLTPAAEDRTGPPEHDHQGDPPRENGLSVTGRCRSHDQPTLAVTVSPDGVGHLLRHIAARTWNQNYFWAPIGTHLGHS